MAFTFTDLLEILGSPNGGIVTELSSAGDSTPLEFNNIDDLKLLFPDENFSDTVNVAYVPSVFCNSYPARNKRGRMFMPKVLANSHRSVRDNLVNIEHEISDNGRGSDENIIGHVKASAFQWKESADLPTAPIPVRVLNALYMRHPKVVEILSDQERKKNWFTSMECGHDINQACLHYRGEFIPVKDADPGMMECVKRFSVLPYKGHELSLCLGGEEGSVDFWGQAFTQHPADTGAAVLGIVSRKYEMASEDGKTKRKYFPIQFASYRLQEKTAEAASDAVDKKFTELASIAVIGKTDPSEDGHAHDVLSNGTIVPINGHTHYLSSWALTRGTQPAFTGHTSEHSVYREGGMSLSHMHLINIKLRGKSNAKAGDELDPEVSHFVAEDIMEVKTMLGRVESLITKLSSGKAGEQAAAPNSDLLSELGKLKSELASTEIETEIANRVKKEVASQIAAGDLVPKADHEVQLKEAQDKAKADADAVIKQAELRQARLDRIMKLGINLESTPYEDKQDETVAARMESIPYDANGEAVFESQFMILKLLKEREELKAAKTAAPLAEAANTPKKKVPFLVGTTASEEANEGSKPSTSTTGGKKIGRHALSK